MATDKETAQELDHIDQVEIVPDAEDGKGALVKPKNHAYHAELPKTPAEIEAEKRFVRKVDLWILPLLSIMYFLASLVCTLLLHNEDHVLLFLSIEHGLTRALMILGPRRRWICCLCWHDEAASHQLSSVQHNCYTILCWVYRLSAPGRYIFASCHSTAPAWHCIDSLGWIH